MVESLVQSYVQAVNTPPVSFQKIFTHETPLLNFDDVFVPSIEALSDTQTPETNAPPLEAMAPPDKTYESSTATTAEIPRHDSMTMIQPQNESLPIESPIQDLMTRGADTKWKEPNTEVSQNAEMDRDSVKRPQKGGWDPSLQSIWQHVDNDETYEQPKKRAFQNAIHKPNAPTTAVTDSGSIYLGNKKRRQRVELS